MLANLELLTTEADDESHDVVGSALCVPVGESEHPEWAERGVWVMRLVDGLTAARVGVVTGLEWFAEPAEVRLPECLVDLAVSQHFDLVVSDDLGLVDGWWMPDEHGFPSYVTSEEPVLARLPGIVRWDG